MSAEDQSREQQLLVEYQCLREEVRTFAERRSSILVFSTTVWIALIGALFSSHDLNDGEWSRVPLMAGALVPSIVILISNRIIDNDIAKTSTYLERFVESMLVEMRFGERQRTVLRKAHRLSSISFLGVAVGAVLAIFSWFAVVSAGSRPSPSVLIVLVAMIVAVLGLAVSFAAVLWRTDRFNERWERRWNDAERIIRASPDGSALMDTSSDEEIEVNQQSHDPMDNATRPSSAD